MAEPSLSFIVPVRNDAVRLAACLASIRTSARDAAAIEVIVVDNHSTDDSAVVAERAGARVLRCSGNVAALRNEGARAASGTLLAFVDADNIIGRMWVTAAQRAFVDCRVAGAGALYRAPTDGTWVQRAYDVLRGRLGVRRPVTWLGSGNLVVRRAAFEAIGGFDETLESCEDVDLCHRLRAGGGVLLNEPAMDSIHLGDPPTLKALFRSELWRGRDNLRVSLRHRLTPRDLPSVAIPVVQAAVLAGLPPLAVASFAMRSMRWGVLAAGGLLLGPAVARTLAKSAGRKLPARDLAGVVVVAAAYDLARALALFTRSPHHRTGSRVPAAGS